MFPMSTVAQHIQDLQDEAAKLRLEAEMRKARSEERPSRFSSIVTAIRTVLVSDDTPVLPRLSNYPFRS